MDQQVINQNELLSTKQAIALLGRIITDVGFRRWMSEGVRTKVDGKFKYIKLRSRRIGGRLYTTRAWVEEFDRQCNVYDTGNQ